MLTVYTHRRNRPENTIDLSTMPLSELTDSALAIFSHQRTAHIWFGYLEGWMLTPHEEVLLRKVLRKFECSLVSHFPLSFSAAWQNEINTIYTADITLSHGDPHTDHDGCSLHDGREA